MTSEPCAEPVIFTYRVYECCVHPWILVLRKPLVARSMSRLDYCNSLLAFTSKQNIHRCQMVQNQLARVVPGSGYRQSAAPILLYLHWLPVQRRIEYKIVNMVFKSRMNFFPEYTYLEVWLPIHLFVLSDHHTYVLPRVRLEVAKQSFSYAGAKLWNNLPNVDNFLHKFKKLVETHYFSLHIH